MAKRQHHKGKKRPGWWHQGRSEGKRMEQYLTARLEPAVERAERDQQEVAARTREHRADRRDYEDCLAQLDRTSPHVPAWAVPL